MDHVFGFITFPCLFVHLVRFLNCLFNISWRSKIYVNKWCVHCNEYAQAHKPHWLKKQTFPTQHFWSITEFLEFKKYSIWKFPAFKSLKVQKFSCVSKHNQNRKWQKKLSIIWSKQKYFHLGMNEEPRKPRKSRKKIMKNKLIIKRIVYHVNICLNSQYLMIKRTNNETFLPYKYGTIFNAKHQSMSCI